MIKEKLWFLSTANSCKWISLVFILNQRWLMSTSNTNYNYITNKISSFIWCFILSPKSKKTAKLNQSKILYRPLCNGGVYFEITQIVSNIWKQVNASICTVLVYFIRQNNTLIFLCRKTRNPCTDHLSEGGWCREQYRNS